MKFRHHRGGLEESTKTVVEVNSLEELKKEIRGDGFAMPPDYPSKIEFQHIGMDARVNWNTYYVIADDKICGMSDSDKFVQQQAKKSS